MTARRSAWIAVLLVLLVGLLAQATMASAGTSNILKADTMVGIPDAFTGTQAPLRGLNGGGIPWQLNAAKVVLTSDGHLTIKVEGLVLAAGGAAGTNPISSFRAVVSCLQSDTSVLNLTTDPFPATTGAAIDGGGNAKFEGDVSLPHPCIAPIVFVTSPGSAWFASTGA
ncbi:MAG TPA: hypothetical protein VHU77_06200 [Candidatus Limnocylindria bacterium]|jgi:hypothetical protein|nr:hypothetical protein [Candidatus Limnocylindria bacterium]